MMTLSMAPTAQYYCWAWNRVYVKSNGRVPCWCDAGEPHTIIKADFDKDDFIYDVVNSAQMREMRLKILTENELYIPQCDKCCCLLTQGLRKHKRYLDSPLDMEVATKASNALNIMNRVTRLRGWPMGSIDRVSEMQVEPSFPCNLRCPGCLHGWHPDAMGSEERPFFLPLEWFEKIIDSHVANAVKLDRIAFVGRGEPTLNKSFPQMLAHARAHIPSVFMSMDSNSTHPFKDDYLTLDKINCSIDGSTKEAYDTYRRGGDFNAACNFMANATAAKRRLSSKCKIRWKYILFNTTEDFYLLNKAQQMANEIGIDELDLVITACGAADGSVTPPLIMNNLETVQHYIDTNKIFPNVVVSRS